MDVGISEAKTGQLVELKRRGQQATAISAQSHREASCTRAPYVLAVACSYYYLGHLAPGHCWMAGSTKMHEQLPASQLEPFLPKPLAVSRG